MFDPSDLFTYLEACKAPLNLTQKRSILAFLEEYGAEDDKPPGLDEVALAAMQGILAADSSPESISAAAGLAWTVAVPAWVKSRNEFIRLAPTLLNTTQSP